jgi:hypothetical protein
MAPAIYRPDCMSKFDAIESPVWYRMNNLMKGLSALRQFCFRDFLRVTQVELPK